jgi:hypothetical protein
MACHDSVYVNKKKCSMVEEGTSTVRSLQIMFRGTRDSKGKNPNHNVRAERFLKRQKERRMCVCAHVST